MALKLRRRAFVFTNASLPQMTGAVSFKPALGGDDRARLWNRRGHVPTQNQPFSKYEVRNPAQPRNRLICRLEWNADDLTEWKVDTESNSRKAERVAPSHPAAIRILIASPDVAVRLSRRKQPEHR